MNKIVLPLCPGAWPIPATPLMKSNGNDYFTCSVCSEPCEAPKAEHFNQLPTHLGERTMVKVGAILGQNLWVELRGHDTEEREKNYRMTMEMLKDAFGMNDVEKKQ